MCFEKCTKYIAVALIPLAVLCVLADLLLYFPNGEIQFAINNKLTNFVWFFEGIVGAGLLVISSSVMFTCLEKTVSCGCYGNAECGSGCSMLCWLLIVLIGIGGSGYCFIVAALALTEGPYCLTSRGWRYPFANSFGSYLFDPSVWRTCTEPANIVLWNGTLFSALLALSGMEFILCLVQLINGMLVGLCGNCNCWKQTVEPA
ncbi:transmembrane 4 L6 family member 1-like [Polyodon spathula]|uniref:transmembrane 4 L6 family member 1-like n=1 Tax=Polyodon spathula TaxID=7913 RepID=UPI001B7E4B5F|nr:transmembrane 4 L6 family member 1-like [Polyodon spathula]